MGVVLQTTSGSLESCFPNKLGFSISIFKETTTTANNYGSKCNYLQMAFYLVSAKVMS